MIPTFLQSLAAQVRYLVVSGKALHVSEATAAELEMLAGLDWMQVQAAPADIAWAWLKLSLGRESCKTFGQIDFLGVVEQDAARAAECAELATIAAGMTTGCSDMGCSQIADPHRGTQEGARAAWAHIAACTQGQIADRYRRELEAM